MAKKSKIGESQRAAAQAVREYFSSLNHLEELLTDFEAEIEIAEISAKDRRKFEAEIRDVRRLLILGPKHPATQKFGRRFRPRAKKKPSAGSYQNLKETEVQQRDLAKKYKRDDRKDLERKALLRAERARREAEIALKEGR